jgi:ATP-dependent protease ClpP protease subunit
MDMGLLADQAEAEVMNARRKRELLAALAPAAEVAMRRKGAEDWKATPGLAIHNESGERELMIYGRIGGGGWFDQGIAASDVAAALKELGAGRIDVRINSGGGDVFDGVAIHTLLARHSGGVTAHIDGLAASAASFIAMAADRIVMARNAFMMIHDGMTGTYGAAAIHRTSADLLDKVSVNIADMYAERAGEDTDHWRNLMTVNGEDGTWYTGQEALEAGLVDEITGGGEDEEETAARLLSGFEGKLPDAAARIVAAHRIEGRESAPSKSEPEPVDQTPTPEVDEQGQELVFAMLADRLR